ncbi:MAG: S1/P1 nuclease [Gemmatimonadaceae bacterium]|nr:S1/P1 nuclease [Gemmatimonadaceae bacterium]
MRSFSCGFRVARAVVLSVSVIAASAAPAAAWGNSGHMASGALAYDALRRHDPAAIAVIVRLMAAHPDSARFTKALAGLSGEARERRLFELMARWPDDIRGTPYDRPDWHYALRVVAPIGSVLSFRVGKAIDQFNAQLAIARDPAAPAGRRALALCWVLHITGDMHQPLHAGHWWSWRFIKSDRAGTIAFVRAYPTDAPVQLHQFWDNAPNRLPEGRFDAEATNAAQITARLQVAWPEARLTPATPDALRGSAANTAFVAWVEESTRLAREVAYTGSALEASADSATAPAMSGEYSRKMFPLADQRLAEASWRIALLLRTLPDVARGPAPQRS